MASANDMTMGDDHMQKLFASDFDGTIHFWDTDGLYLVSPEDTQAILELQATGALFGVCTGRPLASIVKDVQGTVGFAFDFYIAMSGAQVFDRDLRPIVDRSIPREVALELYHTHGARAAEAGHALICADHDYWTVTDRPDKLKLRSAESLDEVPDPICGLALMLETDGEAAELADTVRSAYAGVLTAYQNGRSVDILAAGCSKGTGLEVAARHFGATLTAGIGDSFNDLPLLRTADVAYTFNSSAADVRAEADILVDHASEALRDFMAR